VGRSWQAHAAGGARGWIIRKMPTFRVMTYNILYGGVGREQLIRNVVSTVHPDVVIFTEVTSADSFEAIADAVGPHRVESASRFSREHAAIASRWPIVQSALHGPPWAPRKWVEATLVPFCRPPGDRPWCPPGAATALAV
jgi:hypothetical protein